MRPLKRWLEYWLSKFDRLPLSVRFLLAFILPVIAVVWMSVFNGIERYQATRNIEQMERNSNLAVEAGQLVGFIQRERGISAIYRESEGTLVNEELITSRQRTDTHLARLQDVLSQTAAGTNASGFAQRLNATVQSLANLPNIRERIDALRFTPRDIDDYFTRNIEQINRQIDRLSAQSDHNRIGRKLNAYFILNRLRELLGKERVIVSRALVQRQLTEQQHQDLLYLGGMQESLLVGFKSQTGEADFYQLIFKKTDATLFRDQLIYSSDRQSLLNKVSPNEWFAWQSERIKQISLAEEKLVKTILKDTGGLLASSRYELWRYAIFSPMAIFAGLILVFLIFRHIQVRLQLAETVFGCTHDRITVTDPHARIVEVNDAFSRITGYCRAEVLGENPRMLKSGLQSQVFYEDLWNDLKRNGTWHGEVWNRRKNGEVYAELTTINAVRNRQGNTSYYVAISSDITERVFEHQRQLEYRAYHDTLTGLPNQMLLRDRLEHTINLSKRADKKIIVACVDLDHFKLVNDQYGHAFGDAVLELVSKRLRSTLRDSDSLARVGGDEFLIIIEELEAPKQAQQVLERLQQEVSNPIVLSGNSLALTASIGATRFPEDAGDADTLIRHTIEALHESKHNGRDRLSWFDPEKGRNQNALSHLIRKLENALANKELRLYYQPKVNMVTGKLLGLEALLRWQDPIRGLVPPGEFLPRIEQHPFSILIGNWVIETAISQVEYWKSIGLSVAVSVNINALQLLDHGFVQSLQKHIRCHPDFDPQNLELEILESVAINDIRRAGEVLGQCRNLGVSISLDDFGTGYSSLEYLKHLPAENLKIDQTFVRDMQGDLGDRAIIKGIIGLANAFGFGVIAEGVETEEQGCALIEMGCTNAQGFGIARPMPAEQFEHWLETWQPPTSWRSQPPGMAGPD